MDHKIAFGGWLLVVSFWQLGEEPPLKANSQINYLDAKIFLNAANRPSQILDHSQEPSISSAATLR